MSAAVSSAAPPIADAPPQVALAAPPGGGRRAASNLGGRLGRSIAEARPLSIGIFVACLAASAYALTLPDYGLVSDEGNYLASSTRLLRWAGILWEGLLAGEPGRAFTKQALAESWWWGGARIPHPPFSRELAGLSALLLHRELDLLTAYRFAGALLAGALAGGVAAWAALRAGRLAGLAAGVAFLAMPRPFAHAHFADTDFVLSALFFFALFCAVEGRRAPMVWGGFLWGLALATKFSALILPAVLVPWLLLYRRERLQRLPVFFLAAAVAFAAVNPLLWVEPVTYLRDYLWQGFGRRANDIAQLPTFYFGRMYVFRPPWHYPFVMLVLTLPLGILALALLGGGWSLVRRQSRSAGAVAVLVPAAFLASLMLPTAPLHDDVRLFLPIFPFVAMLAGFGAAALAARPALARVGPALALLALAPAVLGAARIHPYQTSYFNVLVGGVAGAERRGLEVTTLKEVLSPDVYRDLNTVLPRGATLDGGPFLYEDLGYAQTLGWLRPDVVVRDALPADYVLIVNRRGWLRDTDLALLRFARPGYAVRVEGVPLVALYRLR